MMNAVNRPVKLAYKRCFVPECKNTTTKTPDKVFIVVPKDEERRKKWCEAAGYVGTLLFNSYMCEDHFNLKEDLENYTEWKFTGCNKRLKPDVYPRFFLCQVESNGSNQNKHQQKNLSCTAKVPLKSIENSTLKSEDSKKIITSVSNAPSAPDINAINSVEFGATECSPIYADESDKISENSEKFSNTNENEQMKNLRITSVLEEAKNGSESLPPLSFQEAQSLQRSGMSFRVFPITTGTQTEIELVNKSTQSNRSYRSVKTSCKPHNIPHLVKNVSTSPVKEIEQIDTSNNATNSKNDVNSATDSKKDTNSTINSSLDAVKRDIFDCSTVPSSNSHTDKMQYLKEIVYEKMTKIFIEDDPLLYIGLPPESMYVIDEFISLTNVSRLYIYLTLKKIRQNNPNTILAYEFGLSESQVSRIFKDTVVKLAEKFEELIVWSTPKNIEINLPIQFRLNYAKVQSIIDCFEVQIEHLTNAVHQAVSWSDYKKCNTSKYLISITPDGLINFLSIGYGGRASDIEIVKNSGYLDVLPSGSSVLADRGFKQIESLLHKNQCQLLKPPSVSSTQKPSASDVLKTKQIASVRIHVERVIRRLREFKMLAPHVTLDHNLLEVMDEIAIVAAAFVNLQSKIIQ